MTAALQIQRRVNVLFVPYTEHFFNYEEIRFYQKDALYNLKLNTTGARLTSRINVSAVCKRYVTKFVNRRHLSESMSIHVADRFSFASDLK